MAELKQGLWMGQEVRVLWILDACEGQSWEGWSEDDFRSLPAQLQVGSLAAPAQRTAGSGASAPHSCPWLPHSAEDTPQRPQRALHRPGGSDG